MAYEWKHKARLYSDEEAKKLLANIDNFLAGLHGGRVNDRFKKYCK